VFNTLLLLSSDEYHSFKIYTSPNLIGLILAHVGFFGSKQCDLGYRKLYDKVWNVPEEVWEHGVSVMRRRNFVKFWHNAVQLPEQLANHQLVSDLIPEMYNQCKLVFIIINLFIYSLISFLFIKQMVRICILYSNLFN
jgi:hypothetical protein